MLMQCKELYVTLGKRMTDWKKKKEATSFGSTFHVRRWTFQLVQENIQKGSRVRASTWNQSLSAKASCSPLHLLQKAGVRQADTSTTGTPFSIQDRFQNHEGTDTITVVRDSNISYKETFCFKPREVHKQAQIPCARSPRSVKLSVFSQA